MGMFSPRLQAAHTDAVSRFTDAIRNVPTHRWQRPPAPGRWSAAALSLHVIDAYAHCAQASEGGPQMQARLPVWRMWMLRELALPMLFHTGRFPREAPAPPEVVPDLSAAELLSQHEAEARVMECSDRAMASLISAAQRQPAPRIMHPYFGAMSPRQTLMLLTGHTRHHVAGLVARGL